MAEVVLVVTPHLKSDGTKHPNAFAARLADSDEVLCVSETPLFDAARALLKAGKAQPNDRIVMRHAGSVHDALRAKVGVAAKLTIWETGFGPKLRKYKPRGSVAEPPRIAPTPSQIPGQPPIRENAPAVERYAQLAVSADEVVVVPPELFLIVVPADFVGPEAA